MRVDRTKLKNVSDYNLGLECKQLITSLKDCSDADFVSTIKAADKKNLGKAELCHWIDVLDRFDSILELACERSEEKWTLACDKPANAELKNRVLSVLEFTPLLLEQTFKRELYSSFERLLVLLESSDLSIVVGVLHLLYCFSKKSRFLIRLHQSKRDELGKKLRYLAESWGGDENGFSLERCCSQDAVFPASSSELQFQFHSPQASTASSKESHSASLAAYKIQMAAVDKIEKMPSEIMDDILREFPVPKDKQVALFTQLRLVHSFSKPEKRMLCIQARLLALSVLFHDKMLTDNPQTSFLYDGFVEECVEVLKLPDSSLFAIKTEVLKCLTTILNLDRSPKLANIISAMNAASYHGFLPTLARSCIASLSEPSSQEPLDHNFAVALFSFLYHLATQEEGSRALISSGLTETLLHMISYHESDSESVTFVTRCLRVIDLITNYDIQMFQALDGVQMIINRLQREIDICRKIEPYEIVLPPPLVAAVITPISEETTHDETAGPASSVPAGEAAESGMEVDTSPSSSAQQSMGDHAGTSSAEPASANTSCSETKVCHPQRNTLIKSLLNFLKKTIQDRHFGELVHHVFDGPLADLLKHIVSNPVFYGSSVFLIAITVANVFIYQQPSQLSVLQQKGLTDVILHALLVKEVPATREILEQLPNVFTALCLNQRGLESFLACRPFEKLFKVLLSPHYLPAMKRRRTADTMGFGGSSDTAANLGSAMDELMRHQTTLRPVAMQAVVKLLEELCVLGTDSRYECASLKNLNKRKGSASKHNNSASSGGTPVHSCSSGELAMAGGAQSGNVGGSAQPPAQESAQGGVDNNLDSSEDEEFDDEDDDSRGANIEGGPVGTMNMSAEDSAGAPDDPAETDGQTCGDSKTAVPLMDYILNIMKFIEAILSNNSTEDHCREFVQHGGLEPLLKIVSLKNLPHTFPGSKAADAFASVVKYVMTLTKDARVIKQLLAQLLEGPLSKIEALYEMLPPPGGSHLVEEVLKAPLSDTDLTSSANLAALNQIYAYVSLLGQVCKTSSTQNDLKKVICTEWLRTSEVLSRLHRLYEVLVWESSILLSLATVPHQLSDNSPFAMDQLNRLVDRARLKGFEAGAAMVLDTPASSDANRDENAMELDSSGPAGTSVAGPKDASQNNPNKKDSKKDKGMSKGIISLTKPVVVVTSRLGRGISDLFGVMVKLCNISTIQRNVLLVQPPTESGIKMAETICGLFLKAMQWKPNPDASFPKLWTTYRICMMHFMLPLLFADKREAKHSVSKKFAYHLMIDKFYHVGAQDAVFRSLEETLLELTGKSDVAEALSSEKIPDGALEFLESWFYFVEKLVNPQTIKDSPNHFLSSGPNGKMLFLPNQYLRITHKSVFGVITQFWKSPILTQSNRISEYLLSMLCHILKDQVALKKDKSKSKSGPDNKTSIEEQVDAQQLRDLVLMGFPREAATDALLHSTNFAHATEYLLTRPAPWRETSALGSGMMLDEDEAIQQAIAMSLGDNSLGSASSGQAPSAQQISTDELANAILAATGGGSAMQSAPAKSSNKLNETSIVPVPLEKAPGLELADVESWLENELADGAERLLDHRPDAVYQVADLMSLAFKRCGQEWSKTYLRKLAEKCCELVEKLMKSSQERKSDNRKPVPEAGALAARLHLYCLFHDEIKSASVQIAYETNLISRLIELLDKSFGGTQNGAQTHGELDTPKWLSPMLLLIDLYEFGCTTLEWKKQRKQEGTMKWKYWNERAWSSFTPVVNGQLTEAYESGQTNFRFTSSRRRYSVDFTTMMQVNEESVYQRPIMFSFEKEASAELQSSAKPALSTPASADQVTTDKLADVLSGENSNNDQMEVDNTCGTSTDLVPPSLTHQMKENIIRCCVSLLSTKIQPDTLHATLRLCLRITCEHEYAKLFGELGGLEQMLKLKHGSGFAGFSDIATLILRHIMEEDVTIKNRIEKIIRGALQATSNTSPYEHMRPVQEFHQLFRQFGPIAARNPKLFKEVASKILRIKVPPPKRSDDDESRLVGPDVVSEIYLGSNQTSHPIPALTPLMKATLSLLMNQLVECHGLPNEVTTTSQNSTENGTPGKSTDMTNEGSSGSTSEPKNVPGDSSKAGMSLVQKAAIVRLLSELVRSYSAVASYVAMYHFPIEVNGFTAKQNRSFLCYLLSNLLFTPTTPNSGPVVKPTSDTSGCPAAVRALVGSLAAASQSPEAQSALVVEVKEAMGRAAAMPESQNKHEKISSLANLIMLMKDSCPSTSLLKHPTTGASGTPVGHHINSILKLILRKGLIMDLARLPESLDLSSPNCLNTINSVLKTLEDLTRVINIPANVPSSAQGASHNRGSGAGIMRHPIGVIGSGSQRNHRRFMVQRGLSAGGGGSGLNRGRGGSGGTIARGGTVDAAVAIETAAPAQVANPTERVQVEAPPDLVLSRSDGDGGGGVTQGSNTASFAAPSEVANTMSSTSVSTAPPAGSSDHPGPSNSINLSVDRDGEQATAHESDVTVGQDISALTDSQIDEATMNLNDDAPRHDEMGDDDDYMEAPEHDQHGDLVVDRELTFVIRADGAPDRSLARALRDAAQDGGMGAIIGVEMEVGDDMDHDGFLGLGRGGNGGAGGEEGGGSDGEGDDVDRSQPSLFGLPISVEDAMGVAEQIGGGEDVDPSFLEEESSTSDEDEEHGHEDEHDEDDAEVGHEDDEDEEDDDDDDDDDDDGNDDDEDDEDEGSDYETAEDQAAGDEGGEDEDTRFLDRFYEEINDAANDVVRQYAENLEDALDLFRSVGGDVVWNGNNHLRSDGPVEAGTAPFLHPMLERRGHSTGTRGNAVTDTHSSALQPGSTANRDFGLAESAALRLANVGGAGGTPFGGVADVFGLSTHQPASTAASGANRNGWLFRQNAIRRRHNQGQADPSRLRSAMGTWQTLTHDPLGTGGRRIFGRSDGAMAEWQRLIGSEAVQELYGLADAFNGGDRAFDSEQGSRGSRNNYAHASDLSTSTRWAEEARLLYRESIHDLVHLMKEEVWIEMEKHRAVEFESRKKVRDSMAEDERREKERQAAAADKKKQSSISASANSDNAAEPGGGTSDSGFHIYAEPFDTTGAPASTNISTPTPNPVTGEPVVTSAAEGSLTTGREDSAIASTELLDLSASAGSTAPTGETSTGEASDNSDQSTPVQIETDQRPIPSSGETDVVVDNVSTLLNAPAIVQDGNLDEESNAMDTSQNATTSLAPPAEGALVAGSDGDGGLAMSDHLDGSDAAAQAMEGQQTVQEGDVADGGRSAVGGEGPGADIASVTHPEVEQPSITTIVEPSSEEPGPSAANDNDLIIQNLLGGAEIPEGVDPTFLAALPENIRQEVIADQLRQQRLRQQRANAAAGASGASGHSSGPSTSASGTDLASMLPAEVEPEFLAALPPEIQDEVLSQQRLAQTQQLAEAQALDPATFFETLPTTLRQQMLADLDDSQLSSLPEALANEARRLRQQVETQQAQRFAHIHPFPYMIRHQGAGAQYFVRSGRQENRWSSGAVGAFGGVRDRIAASADSSKTGKGLPLLNKEALSCLMVLFFMDYQKVHLARLQRLIKYLCYHPPTRDWIICALMSILDRVSSPIKLTETPAADPLDSSHPLPPLPGSWLSFNVSTSTLGHPASVFLTNCPPEQLSQSSLQPPSTGPKTSHSASIDATWVNAMASGIRIHPQACPHVSRHILDTLITLAKTFPSHFVPTPDSVNSSVNSKDCSTTTSSTPQPAAGVHSRTDGPASVAADSRTASIPSHSVSIADNQSCVPPVTVLKSSSAPDRKTSTTTTTTAGDFVATDFWEILFRLNVAPAKAGLEPLDGTSLGGHKSSTSSTGSKKGKSVAHRTSSGSSGNVNTASPAGSKGKAGESSSPASSSSFSLSGVGELALKKVNRWDSYDRSPVGWLMEMLSRPVITKQGNLLDRLLKLVAVIISSLGSSATIQRAHQQALGNAKLEDGSKKDAQAKPILLPQVQLVVQVLTDGICSDEGLEDARSLLLNIVRIPGASDQQWIRQLLIQSAQRLGEKLTSEVTHFKVDLEAWLDSQSGRVGLSEPLSSSIPQKGSIQDRYHRDETVVINAPSSGQSGYRRTAVELQLPSAAVLTSKNSTQRFLLRTLNTIIQMERTLAEQEKRRQQSEQVASDPGPPAVPAPANPASDAAPARDAGAAPDEGEIVATGDAPNENEIQPADASLGNSSVETPMELNGGTACAEPVQESLGSLLHLDDLWCTLSDCLTLLSKTADSHAVLMLQPAVEAFFIVHVGDANSPREAGLAGDHDEQQGLAGSHPSPHPSLHAAELTNHLAGSASPARMDHESSSGEGSAKDLLRGTSTSSTGTSLAGLSTDIQKFLHFGEQHRDVLNHILRQNQAPLAEGPFAVLVDHTRLLDFDIKRKYFRRELDKLNQAVTGFRPEDVAIRVRRDRVFQDSFRELHRLHVNDWKGRFYIIFEGEEGQDAGGLLREWFGIITREIFNPNYALFMTAPGDRVTYMINPSSYVNVEHLEYFKFVGRIIGKAVLDNKLLECYFTRAFYKHILGKPVKYTDMESEDPDFFNGLVYCLENAVEDLGYDLSFSVEVEEFGVREVRDLKPNGRNILVTNETKREYVHLVCQMRMTGAIGQQLAAFLEGFYDVIPKRFISIFNEQELELLISGLPTIDVDDLMANTEYYKYTKDSLQVQWLWRVLRSMDQADRAKFLQFVTGTSKVPLLGFANLEGMNGAQKFQIHRDDRSTERLPTAHTCFNQLDLPVYETYDRLDHMLKTAIHECSEGFGFA